MPEPALWSLAVAWPALVGLLGGCVERRLSTGPEEYRRVVVSGHVHGGLDHVPAVLNNVPTSDTAAAYVRRPAWQLEGTDIELLVVAGLVEVAPDRLAIRPTKTLPLIRANGPGITPVGPRPHLPTEVAFYEDDVSRRLLVRPGVTGLWQVSGRSDLSWEEPVELDMRYVGNWSIGRDLAILWRTVRTLLRSFGAY